MSEGQRPAPGSIGWCDLTVADASALKGFYEAVAGWSSEGHDMGGEYEDFVMKDSTGAPVGGLCHARGVNEGVPAQWLLYVVVEDLDAQVAEAESRGGAVVVPKRSAGGGSMAVLRDPAGALFALYQGDA